MCDTPFPAMEVGFDRPERNTRWIKIPTFHFHLRQPQLTESPFRCSCHFGIKEAER